MEQVTVTRDGQPPIRFTGEELANASNYSHQGPNQNRWTVVTIWKTKGGKYVARVVRRTQWQGESDRYSATSAATPEEIIKWLQGDDDATSLGSVSQEAVEDAAKQDPAFAAAWVEEVE